MSKIIAYFDKIDFLFGSFGNPHPESEFFSLEFIFSKEMSASSFFPLSGLHRKQRRPND